MKKKSEIFLSYNRQDVNFAKALERALKKRSLSVWRDEHSITAGKRFAVEIENGIREARAAVVLVTAASAASEWVTYEYAFAVGARTPIVAVVKRGAEVPEPIKDFQVVSYSDAGRAAEGIERGILAQARSAGRERAAAPKLVAMFQEENGELRRTPEKRAFLSNKKPMLCIDLWVENVPKQTQKVAYEIRDLGFKDREWTQRRGENPLREFLTDDMKSYGDVEIWARGVGRGAGSWFANSSLYEALVHYYSGRSISREISHGLNQIREN